MIMVPTHVPRENNVHYTQIVWKNSVRMGCAKVRCNNGQTFITCIATMTLKVILWASGLTKNST